MLLIHGAHNPARALVATGATVLVPSLVLAGEPPLPSRAAPRRHHRSPRTPRRHASPCCAGSGARPRLAPDVRRAAGPARSASTAARPSTAAYRAQLRPRASSLATGYTGSDSALPAGHHLGLVARRHPARGQLRPLDERPGAGAVLRDAERPLAAHRADDVGQPGPEPRPVPRLALLQPRRRGQRRPVEPGPELPVDHLGRPGRAVHARPRRRQRGGRPPPLAAEPVRHHDGLRVDRHRQRDDRHRSHARPAPQPGLGLVAHRRLLPAAPSSRAAAGRSRPATAATDFRRATVRVYRNGQRDPRAPKLRVHNGYAHADPGLADPGQPGRSPAPTASSSAACTGPAPRKTFGRTYDVRMFTPSS